MPKTAGVLDQLPTAVPPTAKALPQAVYRAPSRAEAEKAFELFRRRDAATYPNRDENFNNDMVRGLLRRYPATPFQAGTVIARPVGTRPGRSARPPSMNVWCHSCVATTATSPISTPTRVWEPARRLR